MWISSVVKSIVSRFTDGCKEELFSQAQCFTEGCKEELLVKLSVLLRGVQYTPLPKDCRFGTQNSKVQTVLIFPVLGTCCISLLPLLRLFVLIPMYRRAVFLSLPCTKVLHCTYLFIFCRAGGTCPYPYAVMKGIKVTAFKSSQHHKILGLICMP